jgi:excinuclease ABC subunit A
VDTIRIENAAENNLQGISLNLPRQRITVICGVSGSGKSTLAYNILYAEGQRRYIEVLAPFARQFLHLFQKPKVDGISGLAPTLSVQQNPGAASALSTVGTLSESYDYLRLLFSSCARPRCHRCGRELVQLTPADVARRIIEDDAGSAWTLFAPMVRRRKGSHKALLAAQARKGWTQVRVDGEFRRLARIALDRRRRHTIEIPVGRVERAGRNRSERVRLVAQALQQGGGEITVQAAEGSVRFFSLKNFCPDCQLSFPDPEPATFSFQSERYRCPSCEGRGEVRHIPADALFADLRLPLGKLEPACGDGALRKKLTRAWHAALAACQPDPLSHWPDLPAGIQDRLLTESHPSDESDNPANTLVRHLDELPESERRDLEILWLRHKTCPACDGSRLDAAGRAFRLLDAGIGDLSGRSIAALQDWLGRHTAELVRNHPHAANLLRELDRRLRALERIGLGYLALHRASATLSGGELQRVRLASRLQQDMGGILYVLDEPSIGLHPQDFDRLLTLLREIRDQGNTVLVVEHDETTIRHADHVVDLGPGGGRAGGQILYCGPVDGLLQEPRSLTGMYLAGIRPFRLPGRRRPQGRAGLVLRGVRTHNLKDVDLFLPLGNFSVVTGVSGSGKSSLVADTLHPLLRAGLAEIPVKSTGAGPLTIRGGTVRHVYFVDQSPVGKTPRSTPATYTGIFDEVRRFYSRLPEAQARGLTPGHFSYNSKAGRCPRCGGMGEVRVEMRFLPDAHTVCDRCHGQRYQWDVLRVRYHGHSIADILDLSVAEALDLFRHFPALRRRLQVLADTGLGYIRLGQPTPTLSGGEQQRLKLSLHLSAADSRQTVFLLDEPTTGLHFSEVETLCTLLHRLVDAGNTVIAIEHNLDFIAQADYIVDLGPGSGEAGGRVLYAGPLEGILAARESRTAPFLKKHLDKIANPPGNR